MGFIPKPQPIECNVPMRSWSELRLPFNWSISSISRIRMPSLGSLYLSENPLTELPWADLTGLYYLYAERSGLVIGDFRQLISLNYAALNYCPSLQSIDASGLPELNLLDASFCSSLQTVNLANCYSLAFVYLPYCNLDQAAVDGVLAQLVANGATNGTVSLDFNAAPSFMGDISISILSSRGWSISNS
jgi:hypothetical protein